MNYKTEENIYKSVTKIGPSDSLSTSAYSGSDTARYMPKMKVRSG